MAGGIFRRPLRPRPQAPASPASPLPLPSGQMRTQERGAAAANRGCRRGHGRDEDQDILRDGERLDRTNAGTHVMGRSHSEHLVSGAGEAPPSGFGLVSGARTLRVPAGPGPLSVPGIEEPVTTATEVDEKREREHLAVRQCRRHCLCRSHSRRATAACERERDSRE